MTVLNTLQDHHRLAETVVIIDVFRSSNTIIELFEKGASRVIPVEKLIRAKELKQCKEDWIFLGERNGIKLPDFEGDNSPTRIPPGIAGKTTVITTSGGTRCIRACGTQKQALIGSFSNAGSVVEHLHSRKIKTVSFWAVGRGAKVPTMEDTLCAQYLFDLFKGKKVNFNPIRSKILDSEGAKRLENLGLSEDLMYCLSLDIRHWVPRSSGVYKEMICLQA